MRKEFDKSLKAIARPALEKHGYTFDGKRKFIRKIKNGKELAIEYQVGVRTNAIKLTHNRLYLL
ncbi:MAG TPA: hypothetical protein DDW45_05865 [Gammaproteobacteria bacterium]|nr:hypothetical protein [Gammaproteobacteria bacterium]